MVDLLDVPREIRDNIYSYLLGDPDNHITIFKKISTSSEPGDGKIKGAITAGGSAEYIDSALLYVNKSISAEAIEYLYSRNTFYAPSPLSQFKVWLHSLTPRNRDLIRRLEIPQRPFMPLLYDNTTEWKDICEIIIGNSVIQPMRLNTVTVLVPFEYQLYEPSAALGMRKVLSNGEQFWWPLLKFFLTLLDRGKASSGPPATIKHLRLVLPPLDIDGVPKHQQLVFRPFEGPGSIDLEELEIVKFLRCPRVPEVDEPREAELLERMRESGKRSAYTKRAWRDFHRLEDMVSRQRLDFVVRWEVGKVGEVLSID